MAGRGGCFKRQGPLANQAALVQAASARLRRAPRCPDRRTIQVRPAPQPAPLARCSAAAAAPAQLSTRSSTPASLLPLLLLRCSAAGKEDAIQVPQLFRWRGSAAPGQMFRSCGSAASEWRLRAEPMALREHGRRGAPGGQGGRGRCGRSVAGTDSGEAVGPGAPPRERQGRTGAFVIPCRGRGGRAGGSAPSGGPRRGRGGVGAGRGRGEYGRGAARVGDGEAGLAAPRLWAAHVVGGSGRVGRGVVSVGRGGVGAGERGGGGPSGAGAW